MRGPTCRIGLLTLLTSLSGGEVAQPKEDPKAVIIAVRIDTRPFVWKDQDTGQHLGFFWDICTDAVTRAGLNFVVEEIDASVRARFLGEGKGEFNLLCNPTTITLARMERFMQTDQSFSPIVFVANGSHAASAREKLSDRGKFDAIADCAGALAAADTQLAKGPEPVAASEGTDTDPAGERNGTHADSGDLKRLWELIIGNPEPETEESAKEVPKPFIAMRLPPPSDSGI